MNPISLNKAGTVGIVTETVLHVKLGEFNIAYLREWVDELSRVYNGNETVFLSLREGKSGKSYALLACGEKGDEMHVAIAGYEDESLGI